MSKSGTNHLLDILGDQFVQAMDIGARGDSGLPFTQLIPERVKLIGFEPDLDACEKLNASNIANGRQTFFPYAIGESRIDRDFFVLNLQDLSGLLPPSKKMGEREPFFVKSVQKIETRSLDDLKGVGLWDGSIDFIKIDTQGSELEILRSGKSVLTDALIIACETEFFEMYESQPRFSEVEQFLRSSGFDLLAIDHHSAWSTREGVNLTRRKITWADSLFVKSDEYFDALKGEQRDNQVRKCAVLLVSYGFFAEALRLFRRYAIDTSILEEWIFLVQKSAGSWRWRLQLLKAGVRCFFWPGFKNRLALARISTQFVYRSVKFNFTAIGKV